MATTSFYMVTLLCLLNIRSSNSCQWTVEEGTLDLSCLSGKTLEASQFNNNGDAVSDYLFTVCDNTQSCGNTNVMAAQWPRDLTQCFNVGTYDPSIMPIYQDTTSGGQWQFTYEGALLGCQSPREWIPTFICDSNIEIQIGVVTETSACNYAVPIRTKYACVDQHYECESDEASSGLSVGWIFIIIFVSAFFLYCIVGYVVMAKTVNKDKGFGDFSNNIPNKTLWIKCMFLVIAGCSVTKEYLINKLRKNGEYNDAGSDEGSEDESISNDGYQLDLDPN